MNEFWLLILVAFFATNSLKKAESVQLEELEDLPLQTFDEIFGEGWWDNEKDEEWNKLMLEQNLHHQNDRKNTQIGQIQPNSTDQLGKIELNSTDQLGQIELNSTDQNPPLTESDHPRQIEPNSTNQLGQIEPNSTDQTLTESDHSDNANNGEEINSNENIAEDERNRKIIDKFHAIRNEFKQKGKFPANQRNQIEQKIAKHLKVSRAKIYKWKKECGLSKKVFYEKEERKHLIEKFDQRKAELTRDGFKNSYKQEIDKIVAKELGLNFKTIYKWKRKLGQTKPQHKYDHSEQKELIKRYYEIKHQNPKMSVGGIAKMLKIGSATLFKWKKQFERQQFYTHSVDGHSEEVNAAANVQEIGNSNSGNI